MNGESRANLIFLAIFLVVSIPGAVILVKKKMDPVSRPMWIPDGRRNSMVYIDQADAPQSVGRVAPAITSLWLADEARARFGITGIATEDALASATDNVPRPIVSESRFFQLLGAKRQGDAVAIYLAFWNLPRGDGAVDVKTKSGGEPLEFESTETPVPAAVKKDLQDSGLPRPPQRIRWISATAVVPAGTAIPLSFSGTMNDGTFTDQLVIQID